MTKEKISVTIGKDLISEIEEKLKEGLFRNRSHVVDYALKRFLKEDLR